MFRVPPEQVHLLKCSDTPYALALHDPQGKKLFNLGMNLCESLLRVCAEAVDVDIVAPRRIVPEDFSKRQRLVVSELLPYVMECGAVDEIPSPPLEPHVQSRHSPYR